MGQPEKNSDPDNFTKNIEGTIDDLFNPSRQIEIDPLTSEIRDVPEKEADQHESFQVVDYEEKHEEEIPLLESEDLEIFTEEKETPTHEGSMDPDLDLRLEIEEEGPEAVSETVNLEDELSRLNQIFMTLEWEVAQTHVVSALDLVKTIRERPEIKEDTYLHKHLDLMVGILEGMRDHPEKIPTSGPNAMKKGLDALNLLIGKGDQYPENREEFLSTARMELESAMPGEAQKTPLEVPQVTASEDLVEDIKERKEDQPIPTTADVSKEQPMPVEPEAPEHAALTAAVKSHIQVLDECISHILPIEKLLAQTTGMEKLHRFQQDIKDRLEEQKKLLHYTLTGETIPVAHRPDLVSRHTGDTGLEIDKQVEKDLSPPPVSDNCPWMGIAVAQWADKEVAFVPEEVAFAGTVPFWIRKGLKNLETFQLKKVKAWPWSKLQSQMQGELSKRKESQLIGLEFPVIKNPASSQKFSESTDNLVVLVLFSGKKGLVLMLESTLRTISVPRQSSWEPSEPGKGLWAGNLKLEDRFMSVATVESLSST